VIYCDAYRSDFESDAFNRARPPLRTSNQILVTYPATDTRSCHRAGLVSGSFHRTTPRPHEPLHRLPEKFRREVTVPGDHAECPPASKLLDSPEVDSGHDQPGREGVPIRVPSIP
jgi:hypothetical protein